jgi:lipopolysaccharide heptosyltransferase III
MTIIGLCEKPRILVIALRRLGDVLLTTPLIRSLRRAFPDATIDALVFADTQGILEGNSDINDIIAMPARPSAIQTLVLGARLLCRYDLAISTQSGDRPVGFAILAARKRIAPVESRFNGRVKRALLQRYVPVLHGVHRVEEILRLADAIGISRVLELVPPRSKPFAEAPEGDFAILHAKPMYRYKQWTKNGWRNVASELMRRGLSVIATGGRADDERRYLDEICKETKITRLDSLLDWQQLAGLLSRASIYIGPDTSMTHLAAATGCPTVALYGPTDPRLWGPWPVGGLDENWSASGSIQRRGNVWLVQHAFACTPCQLEGCERRIGSYSACLDELPPETVIAAIEQALAAPSVV